MDNPLELDEQEQELSLRILTMLEDLNPIRAYVITARMALAFKQSLELISETNATMH